MRRQAMAGIACALVLAACSGEPVPGGSTGATPSEPTQSPSQHRQREHTGSLTGDWEELGHHGFLELRLGMSQEEALQTGRITIGERVGRCTGFYLAMYGDGSGLGGHGYFTKGRGLSVIHGQDEMHTVEGIKLGSPTATLQDSYAHLVGSRSFTTAPVSDRSSYFFISQRGAIAYLGLSLPGDPCLTQWATSVRVAVRSHCGVRSAWVHGRLWLADPPLGGHNPPPGWSDTQTRGWFVITSVGRAEFHGDRGQEADFRLADPGTPDPNDGCE